MEFEDLKVGMQLMNIIDEDFQFEYYRYEIIGKTESNCTIQWLNDIHIEGNYQDTVIFDTGCSYTRREWRKWLSPSDYLATPELIKQAEERMTEVLLSQ